VAKKHPACGPRTAVQAPPPPARSGRADLTAGVLLAVVTLLAYLPVWHAGFIWDDDVYVTGNPMLRSLGGLAQIWDRLSATVQYYPLVHTSFWLEYHLWGLNPTGYHVVNVVLHILAALLLWRVLTRLQVPGAWLAAGIWALHPVAVESVAWVTERKNVLSAGCYFAAALAYWRWADPVGDGGRTGTPGGGSGPVPADVVGKVGGARQIGGRPAGLETRETADWEVCGTKNPPTTSGGNGTGPTCWYFIAFGLFLAALLSKTVTCSLPAALLLVVWWKRGRIGIGDVLPLLPFFVAGAGLGLLTSWLERTQVGATGPEWAFSFGDRCLIAGRALWFYAGELCWPANLTFIYPRWEINAGVWWQWLFPAAAAAAAGLLWGLRRRLGRGPLVAALFFGGTLFPALGLTNVYPMRYSFVADHFQYLAATGLIAPAAAGLVKLLRRWWPMAALLPLGLALLTWKQTHLYADQTTLWEDTLAKNPACWLAHDDLGLTLLHEGRTDEAISQFHQALRLKPEDVEAHNNLGIALLSEGQAEEAITQYQESLRLQPGNAKAHNNLGNALLYQGRMDAAITEFQAAIRVNPDYAEAHYNLGTALNLQGHAGTAITEFQAALRLNPDYAEAHNNLGLAFLNEGRTDEAGSQFLAAIRLKPEDAEAHYNLGLALHKKGQTEMAINQFQKAVRLKPAYVAAHINLGLLLMIQGRADGAIGEFQEALRLKPDDAHVQAYLTNALALKNQAGAPTSNAGKP